MKKLSFLLLTATLLVSHFTHGQATRSYPFAVGRASECGSGTDQVHFYTYNSNTRQLSGFSTTTGPLARYVPQLRIGTTGGGSGSQRFTSNYSSISFNPADHNIYYLWTATSGSLAPDGPRTYVWRWPVGTQPTTTSPRLDTIASFPADLLGIAFDNEGNGYVLDFLPAPANTPHTAILRSVDFATRTFGDPDYLRLTGGANIYNTGTGDVAISPSGQMFFGINNKLFTVDYKSYTGTGSDLTCTYIDTMRFSGVHSSYYFVGLTYAEGEMIGAYSGSRSGYPSCPTFEINPLTATSTQVSKPANPYSASDLATIISGIGAAKRLVSATPTGVPNQYDVVYDVYIKNYGNMDVTNVQVTDDLQNINGAANVSNVSISFVSNPAGLTLNSAYNGITNTNLLTGSGTLPNFPVANNSATIRISCRLNNIMPGTIYYNSATVTARGFNNDLLTDQSTDGSNPDPSGNDKPDDPGENEPTPLLIAVASATEPCITLNRVLYTQTFGTGTNNTTALPTATGGTAAPTTTYSGSTTAPLAVDRYMLTNNANNGNTTRWISLTDHTGNTNGRMMVVNADAQHLTFYRDRVASACGNLQYSLFFYGAFVGNSNYQTICDGFGGFKYPNVTLRVRDATTGAVIAQGNSGDITSTSWRQYGMKFVMPSGYPNVIIELINNGQGGCGNDIAIDDIQFGICDPTPVVSVGASSSGCLGGASVFSSTISDPAAMGGTPVYQWQSAANIGGPYTDITGATGAVYTIANTTSAHMNRYYRVRVASTGNMGSSGCRFESPGVLLVPKSPSVAPTAAITSHKNVCPGKQITLSVEGGSLGTGASWRWYTTSCGGTPIGTGASINVAPTTTTTYFVRAEGDCNNTTCVPVTVTVHCDIDKDKDGIPDWVESNMPEAFGDHDGDGIINAYDEDYPGFVDNNGDFINDWFQADGDVDGDGIPNYLDLDFPGRIDMNHDGVDDRFDADLDGIINMLDLDSDNDGIPDVVEAGGVDEDGDGKLDNFVDVDGDGLHDLVDTNLFGAYNSGVGLGLKDTDGDGVPNQFDLDSDNDGIPDVREVGGQDANNDGRIDHFIDLNGDGISDHIVGANALLRTGPDINNDGRADSYPYHNMDRDGVPNPYDLDSDGDGIVDVVEAGFTDANYDGMVDGPLGPHGWNAAIAALPNLIIRNSDSDPYPDYLDIDSDNDGIPDLIEGPATNQFRFPLGIDSDGDGIDDAFDTWPHTWGGYGNYPIDTDGDYIPDYLDADADGDGVPDIKEGHDYNFDGEFNEETTLLGTDADGDGLDDRFDLDNTSAKGTSAYLGNGGSFSGDPNPGTRAVVQRTPPTAPNRDWRHIDFALAITQLKINGSYIGNATMLNWGIESPEEISSFEVWRSTDNLRFSSVGRMHVHIPSSERRNFSFRDELASLSGDNVFYKVEVTGASGKRYMSTVVRVNLLRAEGVNLTVKPNPARQFASLHFASAVDSEATIKILDSKGKIVKAMTVSVVRGKNTIDLPGVAHLPAGFYTVQLDMSDGSHNVKLIIAR